MNRTTEGKVKALLAEPFEMKSVGSDFTIRGYASKPVVDRYGEVVEVEAFRETLGAYAANAILLNQHRMYEPIGRCTSLDLRHDGLFVEAVVGHGWTVADAVRRQIEQKIVKSFSIGFRETKSGMTDRDGIYHILGLELLELSTVSVPACAAAEFEHDGNGKLLSINLLDHERRTAPARALSPAELRQLRGLAEQVKVLTLQMQVRDLQARQRARDGKRVELDATLKTLRLQLAHLKRQIVADEMVAAVDPKNGPLTWAV
jgi:HK97 family phage prohead protease